MKESFAKQSLYGKSGAQGGRSECGMRMVGTEVFPPRLHHRHDLHPDPEYLAQFRDFISTAEKAGEIAVVLRDGPGRESGGFVANRLSVPGQEVFCDLDVGRDGLLGQDMLPCGEGGADEIRLGVDGETSIITSDYGTRGG